ncbi:MAG: ATP-binding cassette domain-containing protein [Clostridiales bacterium]|nr:ATP-binding cassette domain-containing protein [Clostridiales bacterium]
MRKRSSLRIMLDLIHLAKGELSDLVVAIIAGIISFLSTVGIAISGALLIVQLAWRIDLSFKKIILMMAIFVFFRGLTRYLEQFLNHLVAFKVLRMLRDKVFAAIRRLAPAKIEGSNKGELISMITGDIELIEVFYAHTISPICIAVVCGTIYIVSIARFSPPIALTTLLSYLLMGTVLPVLFSKWAKNTGYVLRKEIGGLNNIFLDLLRGITEIMQFSYRDKAIKVVEKSNTSLITRQAQLIEQLALLLGIEDAIAVLTSGIAVLIGMRTGLSWHILLPIAFGIFFSFPAIANVASLGNGLSQSLACGERVLNLLEEEPVVKEIKNGVDLNLQDNKADSIIEIENLSFAYGEQAILKDFNLKIAPGEILGIQGESGCGKSTLLKLIMRFWSADMGEIRLCGVPIENINTQSLWNNIGYMTQNTEFFEGTIRDNLLIAKPNASDGKMKAALEKASILDFVESLEHGMDTRLTELGDNFSAGERQRFGLARCFLEDAGILLLDEPTSNLDVLNENIILSALKEYQAGRTIIMVSHRESSLKICDRIIQMQGQE